MQPTRTETTLTGRARARVTRFGRVTLQIEERVDRFDSCPPPPGRKDDKAWREFCHRETVFTWRDAKPNDCWGMGVLQPQK